MFPDSEIFKQHVMLGTEAETLPDFTHVFVDIVAVDIGRSRAGRIHPGQDGHCCGFSLNKISLVYLQFHTKAAVIF